MTGDATASPLVLRAQGFGKRYGRTHAVQGLDLEVRRGEIFGLIGPDGAGKSSLMKAAAGVLSFEEGTLEVFGTSLDSDAAAERIKDRIGLMPQGLGQNLYADLSIEENVDFFARLRLVPKDELAERKQTLLAMTRLDKFRDRPMKQLSGGMKQKLGLVCTLIHQPQFIILDEPTTGVDPVSRRDFWAILAELLRSQGTTALVSTAYMDEASRFSRVALMFGGKTLAVGAPDELRQLARGVVVSVTGGDQVRTLDRIGERHPQVEALGPAVRVFVDDQDEAGGRAEIERTLDGPSQGCSLDVSAPELEGVFIAMLRRRELVTLVPPKLPSARRAAVQNHDGALAIEARGLGRRFGDFKAAEDVSFQVRPGEIFGLLGANGAGKSTVIKMLTGILSPTSGSGQVAGADMRQAGFAIKERIGYMSQAFSLYMDLTVLENIRLYAAVYGLNEARTRERTAWVLEMAGLGGLQGMRASQLPMGQRQRLALGCALVHEPQVVFLDEPTSGVDPVGRRSFWDILFRLSREEGMAVLVTTHYMSEAEHCDHLALMYAGRVVADDSPAGMKAAVERDAGHLLEIRSSQPTETLAWLKQQGWQRSALFGTLVHCLPADPAVDAATLQARLGEAGLPAQDVATRPLSMEDVFVYRITDLEARERRA
nr:ATP-binding cassette domain-containing protein [Ideonella sp. B508-1]